MLHPSKSTAPALKLSVLALALFQISNAYAYNGEDHTNNDMPMAYLPAIIVTASASDASTLGKSASLGRNDIDNKQAATSDTATILTNIPGINVQSAGGISNLPVIRGLADNRLRILVDGVDSIASCPNSMNSPLSYISPSAIEETTVYAGVTPVSVGGNSIGGTIVVESAEPTFSEDSTVVTSGEVGAFYRSNGNGYGANVATTIANDTLSLSYKGSYAQSDNYDAGGDFKSYTDPCRQIRTVKLGRF